MDELFSIQMAVTAVIAFAATFSGVYLSFSIQRSRAEAEEKAQFGRILQGVLVEGASHCAVVRNSAAEYL